MLPWTCASRFFCSPCLTRPC